MELCAIWNQFFVIFGLLGGLAQSLPMDMDSIKEDAQMALLNGAGMAMELADKIKAHGSVNHKMSLGPLHMEKNMDGGFGESSEEDKKRRRRRSATEEISAGLLRDKRSPCLGRKRAQQTTTVAPAPPGVPEEGNPDDLARRKRSPQDMDDDDSVIPDQKSFSDRAKDFGDKIRQLLKNMVEAMAGVVEKIRSSIKNGSADSPNYDN